MQVLIEFAIRAVLIAAGTAGVLRVLNVKTAAARHAAWSGVVVVMLLLPTWTIWKPVVALPLLPPLPQQAAMTAMSAPVIDSRDIATSSSSTPIEQTPTWTWTTCLLGIYLAGVSVLLMRLVLGTVQAQLLVRRAFHRDGRLFSAACGGPVTVGWLRPGVILPESWTAWPAAQLDAVLTHEQEHVRRRDPLFQWLALLNRAVFWFHPLAWWLERRLAALAEEACDSVVLARGHDPQQYSEYLIDIARSVATSGARIHVWGMAMPGAFLEQRIRRILESSPLPALSRPRRLCACIACAATSVALATSTIDHRRVLQTPPVLLAQSQPAIPAGIPAPAALPDDPGVTVSGAERIMHRGRVEYPAEARSKGIEGTLLLDVVLAPDGSVSDAAVISGPMELRPAALASVLQWHFSKDAPPRQQVALVFRLPKAKAVPQSTGVLGGIIGTQPAGNSSQDLIQLRRLQKIVISGVPEVAAGELRTRLPVQEGQLLDNSSLTTIHKVVRDFDRNLTVVTGVNGADIVLRIYPASSGSALTNVPRRLHVDIRDLSPEAAADLRRRLALREGELLDYESFKKELARIHQIVKEFDPHLSDQKMEAKVPRSVGADGQVILPDSINLTLIISRRVAEPAALQQYSRVSKAPGNLADNVTVRLYIEIQGLSSEASAELKQRLAVQEGDPMDAEAFKSTLLRIRKVVRDFDPLLKSVMQFDFLPRNADGSLVVPESRTVKVIIRRPL
jgi:TonB family protein